MSGLPPEELIQREVDGENTPEQSAALARLLVERPELRARHEALQRVAADLGRVGMADPPPALAADVRRRIRRGAPRPPAARDRLRAAFARKPSLGHALSLAAGVVIGAVGLAVSDPSALLSRADTPSAAGAALPRGRLEGAGVIDRHRLSANGIEGHAQTRMAADELQAEVSIASGAPIEIRLEFDASQFAPIGFRLDDGATGAASLLAGRLRVDGASPGRYRLWLAPIGRQRPPLRLRLQAAGTVVERDLRTAADR